MRVPHTSLLVFSAIFILSGCGYMFAPKYSDPIYTERAPLISLRYEYQDLHIYAPVQLVNTMPNAYQVYIFDKDNEVDALFAATYMPEEKIEVYLPQNTLSTDKNGNIFVISPQGRDMPDIKIKFTGVKNTFPCNFHKTAGENGSTGYSHTCHDHDGLERYCLGTNSRIQKIYSIVTDANNKVCNGQNAQGHKD